MSKSIYNEAYRSLVEALKSARREAGVTQQDVAEVLNKPQSYVAKVEGCERRLDVIELIEFAACIHWNPIPYLQVLYSDAEGRSDNTTSVSRGKT